jgi:hypothetical protein
MTRYFFDIGFNDDGVILDFINIAIIKKDGTEYQAFNSSLDLSYYSEPLVEQLMKLLPPRDELGLWKSSVEIAKEVFVFLGGQVDQNGCRKPLQATPELFTYSLGSHKWVAFCQLFGSHEDLPLGFPEYCQDVNYPPSSEYAMTGASSFEGNSVRQDRNLATTTYIPSTGSSTSS